MVSPLIKWITVGITVAIIVSMIGATAALYFTETYPFRPAEPNNPEFVFPNGKASTATKPPAPSASATAMIQKNKDLNKPKAAAS